MMRGPKPVEKKKKEKINNGQAKQKAPFSKRRGKGLAPFLLPTSQKGRGVGGGD